MMMVPPDAFHCHSENVSNSFLIAIDLKIVTMDKVGKCRYLNIKGDFLLRLLLSRHVYVKEAKTNIAEFNEN